MVPTAGKIEKNGPVRGERRGPTRRIIKLPREMYGELG
jgi:hypothetical protein